MKPAAPPPPCCSLFLAPHTPHLCMFLGFLCAQLKLQLAPSRTLSNRWRHERLRMPEKAATAILQEPTRIITDTKGHHNPAV